MLNVMATEKVATHTSLIQAIVLVFLRYNEDYWKSVWGIQQKSRNIKIGYIQKELKEFRKKIISI